MSVGIDAGCAESTRESRKVDKMSEPWKQEGNIIEAFNDRKECILQIEVAASTTIKAREIARLIAAAPELLETLDDLMEEARVLGMDTNNALYVKARDAIARGSLL